MPVFYKAIFNQGGHRRSLEVVPEELAVAYSRMAWSSGTYGGLFVFDRLQQAVAYLKGAGLDTPQHEIWEVEVDQVWRTTWCANITLLDIPLAQAFWGGELTVGVGLLTSPGTYGVNRCRLLNRVWRAE